jgi:hypothetical protein
LESSNRLRSFIPRRHEELIAALNGASFDLSTKTHPSWPNAYDPVIGFVRVKGVWLPPGDEDDPDPEDRVTFSVTEFWSVSSVDEPSTQREGLWLASYSYNGHISGPATRGERNHRYDFSPDQDRYPAYHLHPFGDPNDDRLEKGPVTVEEALAEFLLVLRTEIQGGRFNL